MSGFIRLVPPDLPSSRTHRKCSCSTAIAWPVAIKDAFSARHSRVSEYQNVRKVKYVLEAMKCERSKKTLQENLGKLLKGRMWIHSFPLLPSLSLSHTHTHTLNTHSWSEAWPAALSPRLLGLGGCRRHEPRRAGGATLIPSPALQQVLPCWRKEAFPSFLPTQPRPHGQCPPRGTLFSNYFLTDSNTFCASLFWLKK